MSVETIASHGTCGMHIARRVAHKDAPAQRFEYLLCNIQFTSGPPGLLCVCVWKGHDHGLVVRQASVHGARGKTVLNTQGLWTMRLLFLLCVY